MRRTLALVAGIFFALFVAVSVQADEDKPCEAVPDNFHAWQLLNIQNDEEKVIRWFHHPTYAFCRGISYAALLDCKEYEVLRSVYLIGKDDVVLEPRVKVRLEDNQWVEGTSVTIAVVKEIETRKRVLRIELRGGPPYARDIILTEPCEEIIL